GRQGEIQHEAVEPGNRLQRQHAPVRRHEASEHERKEGKGDEENGEHGGGVCQQRPHTPANGYQVGIINRFAPLASLRHPMSHGLNLAQLEAVNHLGGPCLVLAGAGSGKTRVITHKIGRLIQAGLAADRIAAITFTNKAAAEMRERTRQLVGRDARKVLICTFHALGVRLLREDGETLGLKKNFSILDTDDITSLLKDCGTTTDAATARQWQWTISAWKSAGLNAAAALAQARDESERTTALIMQRYEERLVAYQA